MRIVPKLLGAAIAAALISTPVMAAELTGIEQSPALLIVSAMIRTMDADAITRVLEQIAPGVVSGSKPHREAVATIKASRLNVGQQFDLMRAFKRLRGEG